MGRNSFIALDFPIVFIRRIALDAGKVRLDLGMKKLACSSLGQLNEIEIKALLSFDKDVTESIVNGGVRLSSDFNTRGDTIHSLGPLGSTSLVRSDQTMQQVLSAENILIGGAGSLYKTQLNDWDSYYDIPFTVNFDVPRLGFDEEGRPASLPYMACLVFPFRRNNDFPDGTLPYLGAGKINIDVVFEDSMSKRTSTWFRHPLASTSTTNWTWNGEYHKMSDQSYMVGAAHGDPVTSYEGAVLTDHALPLLSAPNSKVKDRRILDNIPETSTQRSRIAQAESQPAQFSNIFLSVDEDKNTKFLFGIDCAEVYRMNSETRGYLGDPSMERAAMMAMQIRSIKIYRHNFEGRRGRFFDESAAVQRGLELPDPGVSRKLIIESEDPVGTRQIIRMDGFHVGDRTGTAGGDSQRADAAIQESYLSILDMTQISGPPETAPMFRFFSVTDYELGNYNLGIGGGAYRPGLAEGATGPTGRHGRLEGLAGRYGYSVEVEFEDHTAAYLQGKFRDLRGVINTLESYSADASKPENIDHSLNRFRERFWSDVTTKEQKADLLEHCINTYIGLLSALNKMTGPEKQNLARNLINITHPASGNLDGLRKFRDMCNTLYTKVQKIFTRYNSRNDSGEDAPSDFSPRDFSTFTITKKYFRPEEIYDADCLSSPEARFRLITGQVFHSYLEPKRDRRYGVHEGRGIFTGTGTEARIIPGLKTLSKPEWTARADEESAEYDIPSEETIISGINRKFLFSPSDKRSSFLSPSSAFPTAGTTYGVHGHRVAGSVFRYVPDDDLLKEAISQGSVTPIYSDHLNRLLGLGRFPPEGDRIIGDVGSFGTYRTPATNFVSAEDFETSGLREKQFADQTTATEDLSGISGNSNLMNVLISELNTMSTQPDNQTRTPEARRGGTGRRKTNRSLDLERETNIIDTMDAEDLNEIPNQIMALAIKPTNPFVTSEGKFLRNYANELDFHMKYNNLQRMEVLVGFGTGIKDETWRTLTDNEVADMPRVGGHLIRMRPYTNQHLGIAAAPRCSIYNEYFFIGKPATPIRSAPGRSGGMTPLSIGNDFIWPEYLGHHVEYIRMDSRQRAQRQATQRAIREAREAAAAAAQAADAAAAAAARDQAAQAEEAAKADTAAAMAAEAAAKAAAAANGGGSNTSTFGPGYVAPVADTSAGGADSTTAAADVSTGGMTTSTGGMTTSTGGTGGGGGSGY